ncbi:hypothetical protein EYF80_006210 [Liparis tanakae]|uniref:Uncharacterized protein n=1 Tax=Liparis tanakae TaxID=230148 RepID=A0A4Z2J2I1_9TELE|nr:hypothetical protein EYF80_006210 [Liparis tanakae]
MNPLESMDAHGASDGVYGVLRQRRAFELPTVEEQTNRREELVFVARCICSSRSPRDSRHERRLVTMSRNAGVARGAAVRLTSGSLARPNICKRPTPTSRG